MPNPAVKHSFTVFQEPPRTRTLMLGHPTLLGSWLQRIRFPWVVFIEHEINKEITTAHALISEKKIEDLNELPPLYTFPFYIPNNRFSHISLNGGICFTVSTRFKLRNRKNSLPELFWGSPFTRVPDWAQDRRPILVAPCPYFEPVEWVGKWVKKPEFQFTLK